MQAPVVLFVYNRINHTQQVLETLNDNIDADKSELFIFSDAPADNTEMQNVNRVREYIDKYRHNSKFKRVEIIYAKKNKGLSASLIEGITQVINRYGKIIVLEDDLVLAPDFLLFMNRALDYYENDDKIWSISGFTPNLKILRNYKHDVFCGCRGYCWGWATWKNRFEKVDWEVNTYNSFIKDKKARKEFNRGGMDMTPLLKMQHEGKVNSWAIRWCYQEYLENMLTIFPRYSKVKNTGFDGSGTNSGSGNVFRAELKEEREWNFDYDEKDFKAFNKLRDYHSRLYIRQIIGKYWYLLTEYEYCLVYRLDDGKECRVLKPDFRRWYADPIPFFFESRYYVFVEVFDKLKGKGYIGVSHIDSDSRLTRPIKIIEEPFHMSFPNVFVYREQVYMVPECSASGQIRIYQMVNRDIKKWNLYYTFEKESIVDIAVCKSSGSKIYFLASELNAKNPYQTRAIIYEISNLSDRSKIQMNLIWQQEEYTYAARNGGNFISDDKGELRVAQHSTKDIYGKFITLNRVKQLNRNGLEEEVIKKISSGDIPANLPPFIYRVWGIHTYGHVNRLRIADLSVQRFSLGGLFMKAYRRLPFVRKGDIVR